jgi:hypothetical protein
VHTAVHVPGVYAHDPADSHATWSAVVSTPEMFTGGALAFAARGATLESFAAGGAHASLCLLNFLGSSRTLGVVSRFGYRYSYH